MRIRAIEEKDIEDVSSLMEQLIDEIYAAEPPKVKDILKANFTGRALKDMCRDKQSTFYVVEADGSIVAFLFGWLFNNVFTLYWIYNDKKHRGKGIVKELLGFLEKRLAEAGCYKIDAYIYAKDNKFLEFSHKLGFNKGALIENSMFGVGIQHLYKYIGDHKNAEKERKIKIIGEAGHGIRLLSYTLASILAQLGNEVSLNLDYDSAVRSGMVIADLIYSEARIENPIIDEADILIKFTRTRKWFPAKRLIIDDNICGRKCIECSVNCKKGEQYSFTEEAVSRFGSKMFINMIALGRILKHIGINIMLVNIKDYLPPKFVDKNIEAIKYGFSFRDAV